MKVTLTLLLHAVLLLLPYASAANQRRRMDQTSEEYNAILLPFDVPQAFEIGNTCSNPSPEGPVFRFVAVKGQTYRFSRSENHPSEENSRRIAGFVHKARNEYPQIKLSRSNEDTTAALVTEMTTTKSSAHFVSPVLEDIKSHFIDGCVKAMFTLEKV